MDWLSGFGLSGLITLAVSVIWDIFFPLNNLLIACVYIVFLLLGSFLKSSIVELKIPDIILLGHISRV